MKNFIKICILFWFTTIIATENINSKKILSRKRRLVAFPEGSSISVNAAIHIGILGAPFNHGHMGVVWGCAYDLPNDTWVLDRLHNIKYGTSNGNGNDVEIEVEVEKKIKRRSRRDLYQKLEIIIENLGYNGRECILRTLCESSNYFSKDRDNMIMEFLKTAFNFPTIQNNENQPNDIIQYNRAFQHGQKYENCLKYYHKCKISLLDHLIGKN